MVPRSLFVRRERRDARSCWRTDRTAR